MFALRCGVKSTLEPAKFAVSVQEVTFEATIANENFGPAARCLGKTRSYQWKAARAPPRGGALTRCHFVDTVVAVVEEEGELEEGVDEGASEGREAPDFRTTTTMPYLFPALLPLQTC